MPTPTPRQPTRPVSGAVQVQPASGQVTRVQPRANRISPVPLSPSERAQRGRAVDSAQLADRPAQRLTHLGGQPLVAISFDDGPWPGTTAQVLANARQLGVPVTLFVIGNQVAGQAALLRSARDQGSEVAAHSWSHLQRPMQGAEAAREIDLTDAAFVKAGLGLPGVFRPPGGNLTNGSAWAAARAGMQVVRWQVDPRDWAGGSAEQIRWRVTSQVRPGDIVLLHDGGGDRRQSVAAFPLIVRDLKARGYHFVTVSQILR